MTNFADCGLPYRSASRIDSWSTTRGGVSGYTVRSTKPASWSSASLAATVDELTLADWQRLIAFNLDGTFLFCHAVAPHMKRQGSGKIVNISSVAGRGLSAASSSAYAAAKGGIIAFTKKLAHELGPFGVTVNAIAPSMTLTERIRPHWERRTAEQQAQEVARTPLRRVAEARDQARVICFLASQDADFVSGVTIDVTGGV